MDGCVWEKDEGNDQKKKTEMWNDQKKKILKVFDNYISKAFQGLNEYP